MLNSFQNLVNIVDKLRSKNGCPWDKQQTLKSIRANIIEEAYETVDAINKKNYLQLKEEVGDLLLQVLFVSQLAKEKSKFSIKEVIQGISNKLINRHPHIFGDQKVKNTKEVLYHWEQIKKKEKNTKSYSLTDIPLNLPALLKAKKVQNKVERLGFKWPSIKFPLHKLKEELNEFICEVKNNKKINMEEEFGDILFTLVNIGRFYDIDPEEALNKTINKFIKRFHYVEKKANKLNKTPETKEWIALWNEAKNIRNQILKNKIPTKHNKLSNKHSVKYIKK